jgi:hypothetical protein
MLQSERFSWLWVWLFSLDSGCNWFLVLARRATLSASVEEPYFCALGGSTLGGATDSRDLLVAVVAFVPFSLGNFLCQQIIYRNIPSYTLLSQYFFLDWRRLPGGAFLLRPMVVVVGVT